MKHKME